MASSSVARQSHLHFRPCVNQTRLTQPPWSGTEELRVSDSDEDPSEVRRVAPDSKVNFSKLDESEKIARL